MSTLLSSRGTLKEVMHILLQMLEKQLENLQYIVVSLVNVSDHIIETKSIKYKTDVHKNNFVCCTPTYPLLTPLPKAFMALLENKAFFALFSSENLDFPITEQGKKKNMKKKFFLPTYPTKKYRVGIQQTNNFLRMA